MATAFEQDTGDIAVIGMAGRLPGATNLDEFWRNLRAGVESITTFTDEDLAGHVAPELLDSPAYVRAGGALDDIDRFDARFFGYSAREAALLDPQHRILLECAWHALEDAGHPHGGEGVGVYAGCSLSGYLLNNLLPGRRVDASAAGFELLIANDKDYLASRIGYKLGLEGPAVSVQTACSSSLVAVHMAAQALQSYECDLALAGGATVRVPHRVGYLHEEGMILSPDGHCRPFDAEANGTVGGSGAGLVVLKRLSDALADGDRIDAVIKSSAIGNDGADKVGYTAPSVRGQAGVIATALGVAGIEPASITAIEAHGTGTPLGDPIEIAALTEGFHSAAHSPDALTEGSCAIGSVKANIGHLDSAAGISGLLKAVLQLKHRQLAPTVNFSRPNPRITFEGSPFYVNDRLQPWQRPSEGIPLRIGVSSFGFGGTNAHVVLEEAPEPAPTPQPARTVQLLPLSAHTPPALEEATAALATALRDPGVAPLPTVAHTLQTGRRAFAHRRIVISREAGEAAEALETYDPTRTATSTASGTTTGIALLFPGQGSQYPGMGRELYDSEPCFRACIDECAELLRPHFAHDLRDVLYPDVSTPDAWHRAAERLQRTQFAQPALFAVEYALAQLLISWGLTPRALLGHSVGEITAACLSGVLRLPDALRLVARRGALMQQVPSGAMLSVGLDENALRELIDGHADLDVAAVNAPGMCVAAGPHDAVQELAKELARRDIGHRALHTSHAFHSSMLDPILPALAEESASLRLGRPGIPYLSNRTGDWITEEQTADPHYWAGHARDTVRFGSGVERLLEQQGLLLVECGPGRTLTTLARSGVGALQRTLVPTLPAPGDETSAQDALLAAVGRMWAAGAEVDWHALEPTQWPRARTGLPGYPFQRRRYWIEAPSGQAPSAAGELMCEAEDDEASAPVPGQAALEGRPELTTTYLEPRDARERQVADIWQDLLGVAPIGVHDNFIELGGHSLLATRVVARIKEDLGVAVPMRELVQASTVAALAEVVTRYGGAAGDGEDGKEREAADLLPVAVPDPDNLYEPFPLTEIQQAQWIGRMGNFHLGNVAAHIYWEVENEGIDLDRLCDAWNVLMRRHPMLNAVLTDDGQQRILPDPGTYTFDRVDLRETTDTEREARLGELREDISHEMRPTDTWPLFGITAVLLPENRTRLFLSFDLLIADIGSIRILLQEWRMLYAGMDSSELPALEISYRDYVLAAGRVRRTPLYDSSLAYWRERTAELPPAPDLPLAVAPSELDRPRFTPRSFVLDQPAWQRVKERAAGLGVTPSSVLLAVYATVLGGWARSSAFTLNVTVINRLPVHHDADNLVGEFASFDLLPVDLTEQKGIAEIALALQAQAWEDLEHRWVNGVDVLRELARQRGGTTGSVMPIVFTSTLVQDTGDQGETLFDWLGDMVHESVQTPQVWLDAAVLETSKGLYISWPAVEALFPAGMVDEMFAAYCQVLGELAGDGTVWEDGPGSLLPDDQRLMIEAANDTAGPVPEGMLYTGILERAGQNPQKTAIVDTGGELTYGELRDRACALAQRLRSLGVGPNQLVAVALPKGRKQIVAALGVMLAGGAYLPIDPELPVERQDHLLDHGKARIVLTGDGDGDSGRVWPEGVRLLPVDDSEEVPQDVRPPEPVQQPTDLAYVIYTSGSTGMPKGVALSHRAALNTCLDINERFGVGSSDAVLGLSSLSFDLSVYDVFGVLGAGGTLVLPRPGSNRDPDHWLELIREHHITLWNSVPALMDMLVEHATGTDHGLPLRLALLSGDWIPVDLPGRLRGLVPGVDVVSLGGATEAAIWSIAYPVGEVDAAWESIPYGMPLRNQRFHVLNDRWQECPVHVPGELFIGGVGLAEGYWNDPERTAASFVTHPDTGERLYRTGDLGRWTPQGHIEFLGREDFQVKIGGFRIELGEIETALARHPQVAAAIAAAPGDRHHRRLIGYVVPEQRGDAAADEELLESVRALITDQLPGYMVPPTLTVLDRLPLSANGKLDRSALPDPATTAQATGRRADLGPTAAKLAALAAEVIGTADIDPYGDFFTLGGDSIMGVQLVSRAGAQGMEILAADLFRHRTIAELAAVVDQRSEGRQGQARGLLPLAPFQRELFAHAEEALPTAAQVFALPVDPDFAPETGTRVLAQLLRRHPGLRMRFVQDGDGSWRQTDAAWSEEDTQRLAYVPLIDLSALPEDRRERAVEQMTAEMREELDPQAGPLVKVALFDLGAGGRRLVWLCHLLIADLRSLQLLLTDFSDAARQLRDGSDRADLLPPTRPFPRWVEQAAEHTTDPVEAMQPLLQAYGDGAVYRLSTVVDEDAAERLLSGAADAYRLSGQEVALAALAAAVFAGTDRENVLLAVEDDARALVLGDLDVSGSVGSFSRTIPVALQRPTDERPESLLTAAKDQLRTAVRQETLPAPSPAAQSVLLRDLDALAELPRLGHPFVPEGPVTPPYWDPGIAPGHPLVLTTYKLAGRWHLDWLCRGDEARALAEQLTGHLTEALHTFIDHCTSVGAGAVSVSDFPLADLDPATLAALTASLNGTPPGDDATTDPTDGTTTEVNR